LDIIGMTTSPEAFLACEAEMCYAVMAHVTDYDVWHEEEEPVNVEALIATLNRNTALAQRVIASVVESLHQATEERTCGCRDALGSALITQRDLIPPELIAELGASTSRQLLPVHLDGVSKRESRLVLAWPQPHPARGRRLSYWFPG
jgi:5'-methylthioadenosine phosphorylase